MLPIALCVAIYEGGFLVLSGHYLVSRVIVAQRKDVAIAVCSLSFLIDDKLGAIDSVVESRTREKLCAIHPLFPEVQRVL